MKKNKHQNLIKTLTSDPNSNKRFGALIKSKQHDHLGVAPLKEGNIIYCDPIQKANIRLRMDTTRVLSVGGFLPPLGAAGERSESNIKQPLGAPLLISP